MSVELEDEELAPIEQQTPLWILPACKLETAAQAQGILPLIYLPVGNHQEGDWEGDWAEVGRALQTWSSAGSRVAVMLEGVSGARASSLIRSSVRQLLQLAAPRLQQAEVVILDATPVEAVLASGEGNSAAGSSTEWDVAQMTTWSEWASVLPDDCVPVVAVEMQNLSAPTALHLAMSSQGGSLVWALRLPESLEPLTGEVPWLGWGVPTSKGALLDRALSAEDTRPARIAASQLARVGIVFPLDRLRTVEDCALLLQAWQTCQDRGWGVRLLREEEIHQAWHGLEALVVLGDRVSGKGRRQLAGFFAAGGAILWLRQNTGMVEETSFEGCQEFPRVE
jgi:hypothetical protein